MKSSEKRRHRECLYHNFIIYSLSTLQAFSAITLLSEKQDFRSSHSPEKRATITLKDHVYLLLCCESSFPPFIHPIHTTLCRITPFSY